MDSKDKAKKFRQLAFDFVGADGRKRIAEPLSVALADVPTGAGPRSRDRWDTERRIRGRLSALEIANAKWVVRNQDARLANAGFYESVVTEGPVLPDIKRSWQRRAELRLAAVTWDGPAPVEAPIEFDAGQLFRLGRRFLHGAANLSFEQVMIFLEQGFPVNYQQPTTKNTALHIAAARRARRVVAALLASGQCDFLLRDNHGRLASEATYLDANDPALARLLRSKERKQAEAQRVSSRPFSRKTAPRP